MSEKLKYNAQNPKDRFLMEKLFRYLLATISEQENPDEKRKLISRIAKMQIFPYVGADGNKYLGSLQENNISWFYLGNTDRNSGQRSSKHFRIFAPDVLPMDIYVNVIGTFGPGPNQEGYIRQFSNDVVIDSLLEEMSQCNDYTDDWWQSAIDIYRLQGNGSVFRYSRASNRINQNYFLFEPGYCDAKNREELIEFRIYRDIMSHPGTQRFMMGISQERIAHAFRFLSYLGIPNRFTNDHSVDQHIQRLFNEVEQSVLFPCDATVERERRLCELSNYVVFTAIRNDDRIAYSQIIGNRRFQSGIAVRNVLGSYIALNYSLFYGRLLEVNGETPEIPENLRKFEVLHIPEGTDLTSYRMVRNGGFDDRAHVIPFDPATSAYREYNLGNIRSNEIEFYQWIWLYSHNQEIINHAFTWLSNVKTTYIDEKYNLFVLAMLGAASYNSVQNYRFRLKISAEAAFDNRAVLNNLANNAYLRGIVPVVPDYLNRIDAVQMRYEILNNLTCDEEMRQQIDRADFWNRIYLLPENVKNATGYVRVGYYEDGAYEPTQIIMVAAKQGEEKEQLIKYITDVYGVKIESIAVNRRDWGEDYRSLMFSIRNFISKVIEESEENLQDDQVVDLADLTSAKAERILWEQLRLTRDNVLSMSSDDHKRPNIRAFGWNSFLQKTYRNHCQVCGKTIPSNGDVEAFRFRLHPDKGNGFSDIISNVFCLCPVCRSDMQYGLVRRDLSYIRTLSGRYIGNLMKEMDHSVSEEEISIIGNLSSQGKFEDTFVNPIVCPICINGKQVQLYFSWEHFLRLAFMFYDDDKDYTYEGEIGNLMQLLRMLSASE